MEPIATFSGLASGVQWRDMIDQIMQVERRPARLLEQQITSTQTRSAAWLTFQNKLTSFQDAAQELADGSVFDRYSTSVSGSGFKASASEDAAPGSYSVEVLQLATAEKLGGDIVASRSDALGLSGEFWLNGQRVAVDASDSLDGIAYAINAGNTGSDASRVSAAVVNAGDGYQLVLSSQATGADGIDLTGDIALLAGLGFTDGSTRVKHATSDGATSDGFASDDIAVGTLLGLTGAAAGTIDLRGGSADPVTIDLATDSLADIRDRINATGSGVTAEILSETVDGLTAYRLDISGSTAFTDSGGVLATLGVLEGGRGAVAQEIEAGVALDGGAATGATTLNALGSLDGETLSVSGTKADGSAFDLTLEIAATADVANGKVAALQDVVDALNGAAGFNGTATATIRDGRIVVTDETGGASQLGLSITAHNEDGGSMDFGAFDTTTTGRSREIVNGRDAAVRIDGVYSTHASNSVSSSIPGVSLTLTGETTEPGAVTVSRDADTVVDTLKSLVDGYNDIAGFVNDQFTGGEGSNKPLAGDSTLRSMKSRVLDSMRETLTTGVGGDLTRLTHIGIEIQKDGMFSFEESTLRAALDSDPQAVERLLGIHGATDGSGLRYLDSGDSTVSGSYTVNVTQAAATAEVTAAGALADGFNEADDVLTITDLGSAKSYQIALDSTMTTAQSVVDALNAELDRAETHTISSAALHADAVGTTATEGTTWDQVHNADGTTAGVQNGDTITISGRRADATSFMETFEITDVASQTLGDLRDRIQNAVGADATVELNASGTFVIAAEESGSSLLEVSLSSDDAGGGSLQLGTTVSTEGRAAAGIEASLVGDDIRLAHVAYGSSEGFRIEYANAGTATQTELGLGASGTEYRGTDVQGTIGGMAATGTGRILTGADGTDVDGLMLRVEDTFSAGSVTFSRGIASLVERTLEPMLGSEAGSIQSIIDGLDERVTSLNDRIDQVDARIERRREDLIRRFTAMEQAMAVAQNQSSWLMSQIGALPGSYSSNAQ